MKQVCESLAWVGRSPYRCHLEGEHTLHQGTITVQVEGTKQKATLTWTTDK